MALKKRLIFTLLYSDGYFCQSRNFRCQKVGNYEWLFNNYKFAKTSSFLDELIIINVSPNSGTYQTFLENVKKIVEKVFIPVAVGGGIYSLERSVECFRNGADKIIINSAIQRQPEIVRQIIDHHGSQSVVASIDYKIINNEPMLFHWDEEMINSELELSAYINNLTNMGFGEILINSVDKDGTGFGLDIDVIQNVSKNCELPLIVMGGAGKFEHFVPVYPIRKVDAVATANLLNFIGDAIPSVREKLIQKGIELSQFNDPLLL